MIEQTIQLLWGCCGGSSGRVVGAALATREIDADCDIQTNSVEFTKFSGFDHTPGVATARFHEEAEFIEKARVDMILPVRRRKLVARIRINDTNRI
jgi:hypothetical protein